MMAMITNDAPAWTRLGCGSVGHGHGPRLHRLGHSRFCFFFSRLFVSWPRLSVDSADASPSAAGGSQHSKVKPLVRGDNWYFMIQ